MYAIDWNDIRWSGETPLAAYRGSVLRGGVADVGLEVPARVALGGAAHVAVAAHLCQHRCGRDGRAPAVAVDHGALLEAELGHVEAVDQADRAGQRHSEQRGPQGLEVGLVQPAAVDAAHAARHDHRARRRPHHQRVELLAGLGGVLLRVVQAGERPAVREREPVEVEQDRGGHERPGERAAAGLVGARHEAAADLAVEGEQAAPVAGARPPPAAAGLAAAVGPGCERVVSSLSGVPTLAPIIGTARSRVAAEAGPAVLQ